MSILAREFPFLVCDKHYEAEGKKNYNIYGLNRKKQINYLKTSI